MIQCGSYVGLLIVCICIYNLTLYIYTYDVHVCVNHPNLCIFFTSAPLFDRPLLLLRTWFSNCIYAWGHRCDPGSCANEHGQMSQ